MKRCCLLLLLLCTLTACSERVHTPRVLPEWGRAGRVGVSARPAPVGLAVAPDGARLALVWPTRSETGAEDHVHLLVLDAQGEPVVERDLSPALADVQQVQVLHAAGGALHLLWRAGSQQEQSLWYARLPDLELLEDNPLPPLQPVPVSPAQQAVVWQRGIILPSGEVLVVWLTARGRLKAWRQTSDSARELLSGIQQADVLLDATGRVHLTWSVHESVARLALYHSFLDVDTMTLGEAQLLSPVRLPARASPRSVEGPVLSGDLNTLYVNWAQRVAGQNATKLLYTLALPLDASVASPAPRVLPLMADFPPATASATGYFAYRNLASLAGRRATADVRNAPTTLAGQAETMILACSVQYATRTRREYQPTLIYARDGDFLGYQPLTWTDADSLAPVVATDAQGHVYVAWLDAPGAAFYYPVYVATTAPRMQQTWRHLGAQDYATIAWDYVNRVALGVFLIFLMLAWLIVPFIWLFAMLMCGEPEGVRRYITVAVALLLYLASKYVGTFQILTYIPRLAYLAPPVARGLIYTVPILILLASAGLAWLLFLRRKGASLSVMGLYLPIVLIDLTLSVSIYTIGYYE